MFSSFEFYNKNLTELPEKKILVSTLNAHSYNVSTTNEDFRLSLLASDVLLPDGISVVIAEALIKKKCIKKIAGNDIFNHEMNFLNKNKGSCFFLGSSEFVLKRIFERAKIEFKNVKIEYYSPPFKSEFNSQDTEKMLKKINKFKPDVLFIGMTAPKQEIWAHQNFDSINANKIISIGAVFDYYAMTVKRSPKWMIKIGFEWFYRFLKEPNRMWKRYLFGNVKFIWLIVKEKIYSIK